uniref:uncharacterized protein LOC122587365 n=1 Tax=Erigeron canadensis TaxID=72917 RepID=UPI001CB8E5C3|nr:uncharacterized protein LOC122587365 [Erigeron canadensis]
MAAILHFRPCRRRILHSPISSIHFYSSNSDDNKKVSSLEEIRNNLAQFRNRTNVPPPPASPSSSSSRPPVVSFQELYKRNVMPKSNQVSGSPGPGLSGSKPVSLDSIRLSLKNMKPNPVPSPLQSRLSGQRNDLGLNLKPKIGTEMPDSFKKKDVKLSDEWNKTDYVRPYNYGELGNKLKNLRPVNKKGKFSISELSERLNAMREAEEKEMKNTSGQMFLDLRESLIKIGDEEKSKKTPAPRAIFGFGEQSFMLSPPKETLVEKYFHPDHMSSAEKQKLELKKVREKFKISESDCGSSRVQVAQLTTKIKHLATVLHKKDKHSQKGLQAMVQRRKKLLKYLQRTDWESYCFCIAELGLRDVAYDKASIIDRRRNEIKKLDEGSTSKKKKKVKKAA